MDGNNMYPNQNEMTGTAQDPQAAYQQNHTGYDAYQYQETDAGQNAGNYQNNAYQNNNYNNENGGNGYNGQYADNGYNSQYANNGYQNYNNYGNYQPYQQLRPVNDSELEEPVKIGEWVLVFVLMMIPCVNIIMMFVFAFSKTEKKSKSNFFKAYLIFFAIMFALMILFWVAIAFIAMIAA